MLGAADLPVGEAACGTPVSVQVENLNRELVARLGDGFQAREVDLYSLEGAEREIALDALVAGEASPFVLVNERLVCTGTVGLSAVLDALGTRSANIEASRQDAT